MRNALTVLLVTVVGVPVAAATSAPADAVTASVDVPGGGPRFQMTSTSWATLSGHFDTSTQQLTSSASGLV